MVDELSTTFQALSDPTRRAILARLSRGEATVKELAEPFDLSLQAVSKHVGVLEDAGLIHKDRRAQLRVSRIEGAPLKSAADWLLGYSSFWDDTLERLDEQLKTNKQNSRRADQNE
ncbi:MAG: winged helix-turn-helix transcriptional regulator [Actinobacteria bacterium]|nr:winged helix-turn-helix transcriptional regulator [Actinomycetota bacterium]